MQKPSFPLWTRKPGVLVFILAALLTACTGSELVKPLPVVQNVDLDRYLGVWHEIARYPNSFQKDCSDSQAFYTRNPDGTIRVVNSCTSSSGENREAVGKAWVSDPATRAKLKVQFFWPFSGDYWIVALDEEYRWVVVGEPRRKYLWVLARNPELPRPTLQAIENRLSEVGYDPGRLVYNRAAARSDP
jgi:apolipoprotein D and lipocalin family protein